LSVGVALFGRTASFFTLFVMRWTKDRITEIYDQHLKLVFGHDARSEWVGWHIGWYGPLL